MDAMRFAALERLGLWIFAVGMIGLGLTAIISRAYLPGLHPGPEAWAEARIGPVLVGLATAAAGGLLITARFRRRAALSLAILWAGWLLIGHLPRLLGGAAALTDWVAPFQVLAFAAVALALARPATGVGARVVVGLMLLLFGAVHLTQTEALSGLIPAYLPGRDLWPWATGVFQLIAGLALVSGRGAPLAALATGAMFLGWVLVLHLPRLAASPASAFEWTFAITAVALAGAVWLAGAPERNSTGVAPSVSTF